MMKKYKNPSKGQIAEIIKRPLIETDEIEVDVREILNSVRDGGDSALKLYSEKFDNYSADSFRVNEEEINRSIVLVDKQLKLAIDIAIGNIEKFHAAQKQPLLKVETMEGVNCWQKSVPIESVGLYIPAGTAPLFSTVLMLGIPARVAGCKRIVLVSPPDKNGDIDPVILYTANRIGIREIYKLGGVQAIGALAFGTRIIEKTDKIFGPGNQYVTMAKQIVAGKGVAIDLPAGPSEVAILADESTNAAFIAADLLSQAEHGADSQVLLITNSEQLIIKVEDELNKQLSKLPRAEIAEKCLSKSSLVIVDTYDEMMSISNAYAPEHLIISAKNAESLAAKVTNAGSVFIGSYTPESAGDYASGTNHTLPTNGYAKSYSGVNLDSFMRKITFQSINEEGLKQLGPAIMLMAEAEMLQAHSNAVKVRLDSLNYKGEIKCSAYQVY